jgi:DNA-binding CsgD family transcriptional regulator
MGLDADSLVLGRRDISYRFKPKFTLPFGIFDSLPNGRYLNWSRIGFCKEVGLDQHLLRLFPQPFTQICKLLRYASHGRGRFRKPPHAAKRAAKRDKTVSCRSKILLIFIEFSVMSDAASVSAFPQTFDGVPARALRDSLRDQARDSARLRMLQGACLKQAMEPSAHAFLNEGLALAMQFTGLESGAVLRLTRGRLQVENTRGDALPVGAGLGAQGTLNKTLQENWCVRERVVSRLCLAEPPFVALEILVAMRTRGNVLGILALFGKRAQSPPDSADRRALEALAAVLGSAWDSPRIAASATALEAAEDAACNLALLTPREQQVLALLPRGLNNQQLADELGIGAGTIKSHIEKILHKLALKDRTQAAVRAVLWGMR